MHDFLTNTESVYECHKPHSSNATLSTIGFKNFDAGPSKAMEWWCLVQPHTHNREHKVMVTDALPAALPVTVTLAICTSFVWLYQMPTLQWRTKISWTNRTPHNIVHLYNYPDLLYAVVWCCEAATSNSLVSSCQPCPNSSVVLLYAIVCCLVLWSGHQ